MVPSYLPNLIFIKIVDSCCCAKINTWFVKIKIMDNLKKRVPNFTNAEKAHLLKIIASKYANILEDKKTDRTSTVHKEQVWKTIEKEFNSSSSASIFRSATTLKKCYENRKKELRKALAEERKETIMTGGGPPAKIKICETDSLLMSIVNKKTLVGLTNPFDDDSEESAIVNVNIAKLPNTEVEYMLQNEELLDETGDSDNFIFNEPINFVPDPEVESSELYTVHASTSDTWKKHTPIMLQKPVNPALKPTGITNQTPKKTINRRRPATIVKPLASSDIAKKYDLLLDKRLELVDGQIRHMEQQNELIIKKLKMENELLEIELRAKKLKI